MATRGRGRGSQVVRGRGRGPTQSVQRPGAELHRIEMNLNLNDFK